MVKQYLKQALYMLKENRFVSVISIAGTAISIAMIMVVVLVFQVQFASFYPENNRDRMMYVDGEIKKYIATHHKIHGSGSLNLCSLILAAIVSGTSCHIMICIKRCINIIFIILA